MSLKQKALDSVSQLVCVSITRQTEKQNPSSKISNSFFSIVNRKRRRSTDEGQTKSCKKLKLTVDDSVLTYSSHSKFSSTYVSDGTWKDLFADENVNKSTPLRNVRDVSICLKKYLSVLPDKIWTALYYKVIQDVKNQSSGKSSSAVTSEDGKLLDDSREATSSRLENVSEVFLCGKLLEFDTRKLDLLSPTEATFAFQKIKYCSRLQQMVADTVRAEIQLPRDLFSHFRHLRHLHLTGSPDKLCFYWAMHPIAMHCANVTHLKIAYNPDPYTPSTNDQTFRTSEDISKKTAWKDTTLKMCSQESAANSQVCCSNPSDVDQRLACKNSAGDGSSENFNDVDTNIQSESFRRATEYSVSCLRACQHLKHLFLFNFGRKCETSEIKRLISSLTHLEFIYHKEFVNAVNDIYEECSRTDPTARFTNSPPKNPQEGLDNSTSTVPSSVPLGRSLQSSQASGTLLKLRRFSLHDRLPSYGEQRVYASKMQLLRVAQCCPLIEDMTVVAPPGLQRILDSLELKALTIVQSPYDPPLADALRCAPARHLTKLCLSEVLLSHADFASVAASCRALEVLSVHNCGLTNDFTSLDAGSYPSFSTSFPNATEIDVTEPYARHPWCLGKSFVQFLLRRNQRVGKLKLEFKCSDLDPRDDIHGEDLVASLGQSCELIFLELISPPFLSPDSVKSMLEICPKLGHIGKRSSWPFGYEISYNVPLRIDFT